MARPMPFLEDVSGWGGGGGWDSGGYNGRKGGEEDARCFCCVGRDEILGLERENRS